MKRLKSYFSVLLSVLTISTAAQAQESFEYHHKLSGLKKAGSATEMPSGQTLAFQRSYPNVGTVYGGQYLEFSDFEFDKVYSLNLGSSIAKVNFRSDNVLEVSTGSGSWGGATFNGLVLSFSESVPASISALDLKSGASASIETLGDGKKAFAFNFTRTSSTINKTDTYTYSFE